MSGVVPADKASVCRTSDCPTRCEATAIYRREDSAFRVQCEKTLDDEHGDLHRWKGFGWRVGSAS